MSWQKFFQTLKTKTVRDAKSLSQDPGRRFRFLKVKPAIRPAASRRELAFRVGGATVACLLGAGVILLLAGQHATPDFLILTGVLMVLCGLVTYDILSRRFWERKIADKMRNMAQYHDRLVREVARNRNDVAVLKDGLARAAAEVETQGQRLAPSHSPESTLIETFTGRLAALGEAPRAAIETDADREILELEMSPPPQRDHGPRTALDNELSQDFSQYTDAVVEELLRHALRHDGADIFMQPVVALPQRRVRMYEVFGRIRAGGGAYLPAGRYMAVARRLGMIAAIDNLILLRCLQILRDNYDGTAETPCILNISAATLNDRSFMNDLVVFLTDNREMASSLIFDLPQQDLQTVDEATLSVLEGLTRLGCRFSMDRVRDRRFDIGFLKARYIRYIKLDADWLIKEAGTRHGFSRIVRLKKQLDAEGIDLIVEKIESEEQLRELLDFNVDFGEGYLFGKPDMAPAYMNRMPRGDVAA